MGKSSDKELKLHYTTHSTEFAIIYVFWLIVPLIGIRKQDINRFLDTGRKVDENIWMKDK